MPDARKKNLSTLTQCPKIALSGSDLWVVSSGPSSGCNLVAQAGHKSLNFLLFTVDRPGHGRTLLSTTTLYISIWLTRRAQGGEISYPAVFYSGTQDVTIESQDPSKAHRRSLNASIISVVLGNVAIPDELSCFFCRWAQKCRSLSGFRTAIASVRIFQLWQLHVLRMPSCRFRR